MSDWVTATMFGKPLWLWGVFLLVVLALMAFDLGILNRRDRAIGVAQSLRQTGFYVLVGTLFGLFVYALLGQEAAEQYYTGFIIEKSLSLDNIFVISLIFNYFAIARPLQHRVLFWGILGVILLRGLLISLGAELVERFEWTLYIFAAFLVFTGIKLLRDADAPPTDIAHNPILRFFQKHLRVTDQVQDRRFFVRQAAAGDARPRLYATPLFVSLLVVECVDLIFALDSVPAIFAVTTDEFLVLSSNIFAILGLRALYFALDALLHRFAYLKYSLSLVLIFIGGKVFYPWVSGGEPLSSLCSLLVTVSILAVGIVYSMARTRPAKVQGSPGSTGD